MCLFIVNKKKKGIQKKRNIKSRKIDKRKRKMLVSKAFHNKGKPLEVKGNEEWEIEKILNKRKMRRVNKYLVR